MKQNSRLKKKLLVIYSYLLSPDRDAGSLRMYNLLKLFKELSWQVTFAVSGLQSSPAQRSFLQAIDVDILEAPAVDSIESHLQQYGQRYDLVIMSALSVALKYLSAIRKHAPDAKMVFDTTDLQHVREYRRARVTGEAGWLPISLRSKKWELAAVNAADCTWVVSHTEKDVLEKACPDAKVHILSVIQAVHEVIRPFSEREDILFIGSFPHHPNTDAMRYFVDKIYPLLKNQINGEKVFIIGPEPPDWLQKRATNELKVTGYVPDVDLYFERCKLSFAPLRYGAGVNGKVILSMSYGLPVVASTVAAEGIPVIAGDDILIADDPMTFVQAIKKLYYDEQLWNRLSKNGLEVINKHYSVETSRSHLVNILKELGLA